MALAYYIDRSSAIRRTQPADSGTQVDGRPLTRIVIDNRPSPAASPTRPLPAHHQAHGR
ncbi:hypothetical protein [Kitasatospora sp. NPDC091207]|uniref:hypothetical protein n=1 Tax=Kitasatospora sp. NPDC091207 TaxID=3364083 RepID=UPI00380D762F